MEYKKARHDSGPNYVIKHCSFHFKNTTIMNMKMEDAKKIATHLREICKLAGIQQAYLVMEMPDEKVSILLSSSFDKKTITGCLFLGIMKALGTESLNIDHNVINHKKP